MGKAAVTSVLRRHGPARARGPRGAALGASLALVCLGALAGPAFATFHLDKVNEVMLASGAGASNVQYVELLDRGGTEEEFTPIFAPYKLVVYDAAGNRLGEHVLGATGLRSAAAVGREYLVSTPAADAVFGVMGDERLDVALPLGGGQACFEANTPAPTAYSCLTWGAVTRAVATNSQGTGSANGPVPPNGESDQRQADNSIVAAVPTPKASNTARAPTGSGGGTPPPPPPPFAGVQLAARRARADRRGRVRLRLRCPAGTNGACRGRITLSATRGRTRLARAAFTIGSARTATVRLTLSPATLRRLKRHGRLTARVAVQARDAASTARSTSGRLTLLAPARRRA